jgi:uncharacterized membrane protein HdeD (DUF308 family)
MLVAGTLLVLVFVIGVLLILKGIKDGSDAAAMKRGNAFLWHSFYVKLGGCLAVFSFITATLWVTDLGSR